MTQNLHRGGRASSAMTRLVLVTYGNVCHLCLQPGATTRDHLRPLARGGADTLDNCRPAHHRCNSRRGARPITAELLEQFRPAVADLAPSPSRFFESERPRGSARAAHFLPEAPTKTGETGRDRNETRTEASR